MKTRKLVILALFTAMSVIVHYFESLIMIPVPIPGFKLGLANIIGLIVLFYIGYKEYLAVTGLRVLLVALITTGFGTPFFLAAAGNSLAVLISLLLYFLTRCSIYGISTSSALFHVLGQILMYMALTENVYMITYLPILAATSVVSGFILATIANEILKRLPPIASMIKMKGND